MLTDSDTVKTTFIRGEPELCRAFLFETAICWANEGKQVYYFTPKAYDSLPPIFHDRKEPSATALKFITFIYTPNYDSLSIQLIRLPTFQRLASLILVEDLDHFTKASPGGTVESSAGRCCALLLNTASTSSRLAGRPVWVCASATCDVAGVDESRRNACYEVFFDRPWSMNSETRDDGTEAVWMRQKGGVSIEFTWLDDPVLVWRKILGGEEEKRVWNLD